jgi:1-acyl-sn-glycerol-3-phosphate acyltransferase
VRLFLERLYGAWFAVVFGVFTVVIVCPLIVLGPTLPIRKAIGRGGIRLGLLLAGTPMRVTGLEHLPSTPCVAAANHCSYMDGLLLCAALPSRFTFVVQDGAADWPMVGLVIRRMGVTFVNRTNAREGAAQTRLLIRRVGEGESLAIFPEGTFETHPGLLAFKKGAFLIAARAAVPVVPVGIRGSRRLLGGGRRLFRFSPIAIQVLPAIPANADAGVLRDAARAAVLGVCGEGDSTITT